MLRFEILQGGREVVAHEVKLVPVVAFGIMKCGFRGRHGENQPTVAGVNAGELQDVAKEGPVRFRVRGMDHNMRAVDHG